MGAKSFTNFKAHLKLRMGNNDAWDPYYGEWVNSAYRYLTSLDRVAKAGRSAYFPQLETSEDKTTTAGYPYVAVPSDALTVRECFDATNKTHLEWMSWGDYVSQTNRDETTSRGKPAKWHRRGAYIYLYPTPDGEHTIRAYYRKLVADLSGGTDVTAIGAEWDDIILELAHYFARLWNNEYDKAKVSHDDAFNRIAQLMTVYDDEEKARREVMRPDEQGTWQPTY